MRKGNNRIGNTECLGGGEGAIGRKQSRLGSVGRGKEREWTGHREGAVEPE